MSYFIGTGSFSHIVKSHDLFSQSRALVICALQHESDTRPERKRTDDLEKQELVLSRLFWAFF